MGKGGGRGEKGKVSKRKETSFQLKDWSEIVLPLLTKGKVHHQASEVKVVTVIFFSFKPFSSATGETVYMLASL